MCFVAAVFLLNSGCLAINEVTSLVSGNKYRIKSASWGAYLGRETSGSNSISGLDSTIASDIDLVWTYTNSNGVEHLEIDGYYMSITNGNANTVRFVSSAASWEQLSITVKPNESPRMCIYGTANSMYASLYWKSYNYYLLKRASTCGPWESYLFYDA